jgi:type IV pilus assembly protein PilA
MRKHKGFSLIELLIVVAIILIIAAIAIPNLLASRRAANEASAVSSLRTIHSSEITYFSTTGLNTSYGTLANLNTDGLIDGTLAGATSSASAKSGYFFTLNTGTGAYCTTATPSSSGTTGTGNKWLGVSTPGVIYQATVVGSAPACAAGVISGGTAIN